MSFLQNLWLCFHPLLCQPHCYLIFELIRSHNGGKTVRILIPKAKKEDFFLSSFQSRAQTQEKGANGTFSFSLSAEANTILVYSYGLARICIWTTQHFRQFMPCQILFPNQRFQLSLLLQTRHVFLISKELMTFHYSCTTHQMLKTKTHL